MESLKETLSFILTLILICIPVAQMAYRAGVRHATPRPTPRPAPLVYTLQILDRYQSGNVQWVANRTDGTVICSGYCHANRWPAAAHEAVENELTPLPEVFETYFREHGPFRHADGQE